MALPTTIRGLLNCLSKTNASWQNYPQLMLGFLPPQLASFIMIKKQVKINFCLFYKATPMGTLLPNRFDHFKLRRRMPSEHVLLV